MATTATPWCGNAFNKLYLTSGQFTSTLKDSEAVSGVDATPIGISWDGTNTPWIGGFNDKLYLQSGQFTSTLKTSEAIGGTDFLPEGISWDGTNTPWIAGFNDKLFLTSGQFTSTLKTSEAIGGTDFTPTGISWDGTNTPWTGTGDDKLYLTSGQFTSTLNTSQPIDTIDVFPRDISWDGTNTPWVGRFNNKLYLQSGQFTSTLKTSEAIGGIDGTPEGIDTDDVDSRLGVEVVKPPIFFRVWKDPTYRGTHFLETILAAEGFDVGDPAAVLRGREALTNAANWIWCQADWEWAVSPDSPGRFEVLPTTRVVVDSAAGQKVLSVADTGEFAVDDTIVVAEGVTGKQELATINAIVAGVNLTLNANLANAHDADDRASVRLVRPVVLDPSVRTRTDASASGRTLNVEHTQGFAVDDFLVIDPGGPDVEIRQIESITGTSGGSLLCYGTLDTAHASGVNVYKAVEGDPAFDLRRVNGGTMADFGRCLLLSVDHEGPLMPMNPTERAARRGRTRTGNLTAGDRYVIEGEPPTLKFDIVPAAPKTLVMHYLRAPTRFFGDDDVQMPYPFQSLLLWTARILLRKDGPASAVLAADSDVMSEVERLKRFSVNAEIVTAMRSLA